MNRLPLGFLLAAACLSAAPAEAQNTRLRLSGFLGNMGNNTVAQYDQGFRDSATGTLFRVDITSLNTIRTTSVYIRANAATMSNGKPVGECYWRRTDLATWNPLTTTDALIESRVIQTNGTLWSNTVFFRCDLAWASDAPGTPSVGLTFTLQVTP